MSRKKALSSSCQDDAASSPDRNEDDCGNFEIRVALIGYVSVGKTMILNALLKDKYSEVSMQRATAGINHFRTSTMTEVHENNSRSSSSSRKNPNGKTSNLRSAQDTLQETTSDNKNLRNSDALHHKVFDIQLDEPLLADTRNDTKLVFIDVPGINEAGVSQKYKDYVSNNWHTFDCVVVVLDGRQGVNTEEQVQLLELAQSKCKEIKNLPLIVLLNKIDDPDDEEQEVLVKEATQKVERMFHVSDRVKFLDQIISGKAKNNANAAAENSHSPIVIPVSAVYAYIYRTAASLDQKLFQAKIDSSLMEKLGKEAYGRRWKKFSAKEKLEKAFEVIQDDDQYEDGLELSRFNDFLKALAFCVGGKATQKRLIDDQIHVSISRLSSSMDYVAELRSIYDKSRKLEQQQQSSVNNNNDAGSLAKNRFMDLFQQSSDGAVANFLSGGPKEVLQLDRPMSELLAFCKLTQHMGTLDDTQATKLLDLGRSLVLKQIDAVLSMEEKWKVHKLTTYDEILICGALLGPARERFFDEQFGPLARILLEKKF